MRQLIAVILVSAFCTFSNKSQANLLSYPAAPESTTYPTTNASFTGTYLGTLPCADCQGINMELTLQENGKAKSKTFILKQKYLGKPANANNHFITGKWFLATGNKQNPKAKILQLIPDGKDDLMYFELMKDGSIKLLDKRQAQIKSKHNYTLKKQRA